MTKTLKGSLLLSIRTHIRVIIELIIVPTFLIYEYV